MSNKFPIVPCQKSSKSLWLATRHCSMVRYVQIASFSRCHERGFATYERWLIFNTSIVVLGYIVNNLMVLAVIVKKVCTLRSDIYILCSCHANYELHVIVWSLLYVSHLLNFDCICCLNAEWKYCEFTGKEKRWYRTTCFTDTFCSYENETNSF